MRVQLSWIVTLGFEIFSFNAQKNPKSNQLLSVQASIFFMFGDGKDKAYARDETFQKVGVGRKPQVPNSKGTNINKNPPWGWNGLNILLQIRLQRSRHLSRKKFLASHQENCSPPRRYSSESSRDDKKTRGNLTLLFGNGAVCCCSSSAVAS